MPKEFTLLNGVPDTWPSAPLAAEIRARRGFWKGKRAVVTGAFGFLGGHLCRALVAAGCFVTALDKCTADDRDSQLNLTGLRTKLDVLKADITDREAMQNLVVKGNYDYIFHLAAGATVIEKALNSPYETILANTMGFVNLAEGARLLPEEKRPVVIYSSTDKVYGEAEVLPYTETSNLGGIGVYDSAKLAADIFAGTYHKALGVPTIVLRMCNLFGPYDYNIDYRLIPKALRNIFRESEGPELYLNAREHFRDYIYVEDAARAFMMLAENDRCKGRVYNLPGVIHSATPDVLASVVETVVKMQDEAYDKDPASQLGTHKWSRSIRVVPSDPKLIVISKQNLDGSRIREEAGFEPEVSFRQGLKNTISFYSWLFFQDKCEQRGIREAVAVAPDASPVPSAKEVVATALRESSYLN